MNFLYSIHLAKVEEYRNYSDTIDTARQSDTTFVKLLTMVRQGKNKYITFPHPRAYSKSGQTDAGNLIDQKIEVTADFLSACQSCPRTVIQANIIYKTDRLYMIYQTIIIYTYWQHWQSIFLNLNYCILIIFFHLFQPVLEQSVNEFPQLIETCPEISEDVLKFFLEAFRLFQDFIGVDFIYRAITVFLAAYQR